MEPLELDIQSCGGAECGPGNRLGMWAESNWGLVSKHSGNVALMALDQYQQSCGFWYWFHVEHSACPIKSTVISCVKVEVERKLTTWPSWNTSVNARCFVFLWRNPHRGSNFCIIRTLSVIWNQWCTDVGNLFYTIDIYLFLFLSLSPGSTLGRRLDYILPG